MRLLRPHDYRRTRWKNDGGWTTQIASDPADPEAVGGAFRWRVSIAEIERDGPFSSFPGVDRDLLLLEGNGIELDIDDAPTRTLRQRLEGVRFAGESSVDCRLLAGATRDFNVMTRRDAVVAETLARPLAGAMLVFGQARTLRLVHVWSGQATFRTGGTSLDARQGDTVIASPAVGERLVIDGAGELVLVTFRDVDA